jgi:hypothetical protein
MTEKERRAQYYLLNKEKELSYGKLYKQRNRERLLIASKEYYYEHKVEASKRHKQYRKSNQRKLNEYNDNYKKLHVEKIREQDRTYRNHKYQTDVNYRLRVKLRARLGRAIKMKTKVGSAIKDLGCSVECFRKYIETKFSYGMTWDNYGRGGWHLDHIIPLKKFDLSDRVQFLIACNYMNYQPMWEAENIKKRDFSVLDFRDGIF